jgi:hypothetical protein
MYRSPQTISDEIKQAIRHHAGGPALYQEFGKEFVEQSYKLPREINFRIALHQLLTNPLGYLVVKVINLYALFVVRRRCITEQVRWEVIQSSKSNVHSLI